MRVLQINTVCGFGSTGSICVDIADRLLTDGHECVIAYGQLSTNYKFGYKIGSKFENHLHNLLSRITGKQGYFSENGTKRLINKIKGYKPDVIHLHNLHGNYLNLKILFKYLEKANIPIVWTLHDCWAFTGKCAHYFNVKCYKWQTHCNTCPQVDKYPASILLDRSSEMFSDKKMMFNSVRDMTIVPVSKWLASEVSLSFFNNYPINQIYNWVDYDVFVFKGFDKRIELGIDQKKFVVLCVGAHWSTTDTKFLDLIKLSEIVNPDVQIVMVGKLLKTDLLPPNVLHIPYVNGKSEMAEFYSMADVYVHLSIEDTFGKVIAEAQSCGTPVIVYNSTACPEVVGEGCGYVIAERNIPEMWNKIQEVRRLGRDTFSNKCVEFVKNNFDIDQKINETIALYKQKC